MSTHSTAMLLITIGMKVAALAEGSGYVDLYRDAYFKHKIVTVRNVQTDTCYNLACPASDNVVTSAKWSGLPESGVAFKSGSALIAFYTDRYCSAYRNIWPLNTQSRDDLYFPENFRLDGINDAISSFLVFDEAKMKGHEDVCNEAGLLDNSTALGYDNGSEGSSTVTNSTVE
ncbi:hypothetical protein F442_12733 [Phytophthora nicotianae P10297]|uniref:Uncharacterized protein n=4 Tax=Phytophthora nicotianae TaxID=4792 RepID=W2Q048_PHYN3|nr:hypothetical protein PPTG_14357 [Phytophthora nicotianae INRA-310]ETN05670.1 hypothetical protein PPTG_14357 [Phytophthora nicotianae INRA-310]ETO70617.1 hypothetical protein F444_12932 [Phytophthora nicotianae P1976]ETP39862.1 hypothetical protein F442_12733 [Phytophthora nicotianae P10297]KUF92096.1 Equilibrative Nucleoside Transporter (ENT) Family [Phytophthora nicotianae]